MPVDKPVQTQTPKWKYTFAQTQPFKVLGQCNDVEGLGLLNLSHAKGDLLISFDDGKNYARVGEVLYCYGVKDLTSLIQDRDAHNTWMTGLAAFKGWMYWASKTEIPKVEVPQKITKGQPTVWNNQYQKLSEFKPIFTQDLFRQLLKSRPPLRLPDLTMKEKDWTTPHFEFGPFVVDTDDTQGQAGTQTPEQMQAQIKNLKEQLVDAKSGADAIWDVLQAEKAKTENLQRTIASFEEARRTDLEYIKKLEHQHEADVNLAKTQARVLRGYQQEVNDLKGTISKIAKDRDNLECEKVVAELELTLATRRSDAWELEARRRGYVGGGQ